MKNGGFAPGFLLIKKVTFGKRITTCFLPTLSRTSYTNSKHK